MKKEKRKRNIRSKGGELRKKTKNPGLKQNMHPKSRWEYIDCDYFDKLNAEEKKMMSKFIDEFYGAAIKKRVQKNDLHRTKAQRKDCTDRNNARNRDELSRGKARGTIDNLEDSMASIDKRSSKNRQEDDMIELLDSWKDLGESEEETSD